MVFFIPHSTLAYVWRFFLTLPFQRGKESGLASHCKQHLGGAPGPRRQHSLIGEPVLRHEMIFKGLVEQVLARVVVPYKVVGFVKAREKLDAEERKANAVQQLCQMLLPFRHVILDPRLQGVENSLLRDHLEAVVGHYFIQLGPRQFKKLLRLADLFKVLADELGCGQAQVVTAVRLRKARDANAVPSVQLALKERTALLEHQFNLQ